jgi:hypothetical protein
MAHHERESMRKVSRFAGALAKVRWQLDIG